MIHSLSLNSNLYIKISLQKSHIDLRVSEPDSKFVFQLIIYECTVYIQKED